jgi:16S rRNA A1518/A1519 N6-dimethyltransferase RsmA/KsgA/DIM1 with predicted DNA glycosylase/AP lyase activity
MAPRPNSTLWRTQNFLRRTTPIERLIARSGLNPSDVVYDIGAGTGVLTAMLARRVGRVIAIEKDEALSRQLRRRFADRPNVTIRHADFMEYRLPRAPYKVVANPPFDITAAIVTKLTSARTPPDDVLIALQSQAADRYCGRPRETLAALLLAPSYEAAIVHRFRREDFVPVPGVDVVMLRLRKRGPPLVAHQHRRLYRDFVVTGFTAWRPSIGGALERRLGPRVTHRLLAAVELEPDRRPSDVPFAMWLRLFETFSRLPAAVRGRVAGAEDRLSRQQRRIEKRHRTRVPRDDLIAPLRRQPHEVADAFDDALAREHAGERSRPWVVSRTHEHADRHLAAVR